MDFFLQYNKRHNEKVNSLIDPLKVHFGIDIFWFWKIYPEGKAFTLSSYHDLAIIFHEGGWIGRVNYLVSPENYRNGWCFLDCDPSVRSFLEKSNIKQSIHHPIMFVRKDREGAVYLYGMAAKKHSRHLPSIYMNNQNMLLLFIDYFYREYAVYERQLEEMELNLVEIIGEKRFYNGTYTGYNEIVAKERTQFLTKLTNDPHHINDATRLTRREKEVLSISLDGKSAREVALQLHLSPRTVEGYIDSAKQKLGIDTKHKLIQRGKIFQLAGLL